MKVGDLVRHRHFGYIGILLKRMKLRGHLFSWEVLRHGQVRVWAIEDIEVINESR